MKSKHFWIVKVWEMIVILKSVEFLSYDYLSIIILATIIHIWNIVTFWHEERWLHYRWHLKYRKLDVNKILSLFIKIINNGSSEFNPKLCFSFLQKNYQIIFPSILKTNLQLPLTISIFSQQKLASPSITQPTNSIKIIKAERW